MTTEPKLAPCACSCGRVPETYNMQSSLTDSVVTIVECKNRACFVGQCYPARTLKYWNELQELITKQRRADFEAGYDGGLLSPYRTDEDAPGQFKATPNDLRAEAAELFEQHLAKEREK